MTLIQSIVSRYGGWLSADKQSGAIPAPGHSARDRSVSLRLNQDGKLLIHCFSDTDWRDIRSQFLRDGSAREEDFVTRGGSQQNARPAAAPKRMPMRSATLNHAKSLWATRSPISNTLAERYLNSRGLAELVNHPCFGFLPSAPMSPKPDARGAPCLLAKISSSDGAFAGIQATFFFQTRTGLEKRRLIFGRQSGYAVHLAPPGASLIIGEGVETAASAAALFDAPAWALINSANLAKFVAPAGVEHLIIAADHDEPGMRAAQDCRALNATSGIRCEIKAPSEYGYDWNDVYCAS